MNKNLYIFHQSVGLAVCIIPDRVFPGPYA